MKDYLPRIKQLHRNEIWDAVDQWAFVAIVFLAGLFIGGYFLTLY